MKSKKWRHILKLSYTQFNNSSSDRTFVTDDEDEFPFKSLLIPDDLKKDIVFHSSKNQKFKDSHSSSTPSSFISQVKDESAPMNHILRQKSIWEAKQPPPRQSKYLYKKPRLKVDQEKHNKSRKSTKVTPFMAGKVSSSDVMNKVRSLLNKGKKSGYLKNDESEIVTLRSKHSSTDCDLSLIHI